MVGVSTSYYLTDQPRPLAQIAWEDSYLRVRLADMQAFFPAGFLVKPGFLVISSHVRCSFQPDVALDSVQHVTAFEKNTPYRIGLRTNLTDWLPARTPDTINMTLQYTVMQDSPFAQLAEKLGQAKLSAAVSLFRADWAVAVRVSEIAGRILSLLLQEGSRHELLQLTQDFNQAQLRTGLHAIISTKTDEHVPPSLAYSQQYGVADPKSGPLLRHNFVVLDVQAIPRMGPERVRDEAWWELLETARANVLDAHLADAHVREAAQEQWRTTLGQVRALARKARGFLKPEIDALILSAQHEVDKALAPHANQASIPLPRVWSDVLGVTYERDIVRAVRDYEDALALTRDLLRRYDEEDG